MIESTTVTVGLDVHARSIRLAAVRADELLGGAWTLPYDEEASARPRLVSGRRSVAMRRDRPASVSIATWLSGGSSARWWRRAWCRSVRGIGSRPIRATHASSPGCMPVGCSSQSTSLRRSSRRPAIWCGPARTPGWTGCATGIGFRSSAYDTGECSNQWLDGTATQMARRAALRAPGRADHLRHLPARRRPRRCADRATRARDPRDRGPKARGVSSSSGCVVCAGSTR